MEKLLLASQSPRRHELLALLGLPFDTLSPNIIEAPQAGEPPPEMAARLSLAKTHAARRVINRTRDTRTNVPTDPQTNARTDARSMSAMSATSITSRAPHAVVACDTVVALNGSLLGKPRDEAEARRMLSQLRARPHAVYSAFTILETTTDRTLTEIVETEVVMRLYSDAEIAAYVASGDPMDKAGAYAIQHAGFHPVAELRGCYANVMGLPLCHLAFHLNACGYWSGRTTNVRNVHNIQDARHSRGIRLPRDVPAACQAHTNRNCAVYGRILAALSGELSKNDERQITDK